MLTSIPFAAIRYRCLRCGEERTVPVTDLEVKEPAIQFAVGEAYMLYEGRPLFVPLQGGLPCPVHHCPDLGIGFEAIVGFDKTEPPDESNPSDLRTVRSGP